MDIVGESPVDFSVHWEGLYDDDFFDKRKSIGSEVSFISYFKSYNRNTYEMTPFI